MSKLATMKPTAERTMQTTARPTLSQTAIPRAGSHMRRRAVPHPGPHAGPHTAFPRLARLAALLMQVVLVLGASSGLARAQQAEPQSYDVELIIFRTLSSDATAEDWPREADTGPAFSLPDDEASPLDTEPLDAAPRTISPAAENFPALPASRYQLTAIADTLRRSRNYRPLAHFGWTQPGYPRHAAKSLSIDSKVPGGSGLSGRIALTRGRYLHLTLDLTLETATSPGHPAVRYVLHQSRRMRSNERHYIDHPNFGVIALITPTSE